MWKKPPPPPTPILVGGKNKYGIFISYLRDEAFVDIFHHKFVTKFYLNFTK
jgi:hypothetical protein